MKNREAALPPGPRGFIPLRELRAIRRNIVDCLTLMSDTYGGISCFRVGPQLIYLVRSPELIQEVLVTRQASLHKTFVFNVVQASLGEGMLTTEGDLHQRQRRTIQPAFHKERVYSYAETMIRKADLAASAMQDDGRADMANEMRRLTLSIVAETLFGTDIGAEASDISAAINQLAEVFTRVKSPLGPVFDRVPFTPMNRRFNRAKRRLDETIYRIIRDRRRSTEEHEDLLGLLLNARDEEGAGLSDRRVRDEAFALLVAGHETAGITLSWAWYLLSQSPDVEDEFHRELDTVLGSRLPQPGDLERLSFTRNIIVETTLILATLGQRWRFRLAHGHSVSVESLANLRPRGGMPMIVERRFPGSCGADPRSERPISAGILT